MITINEDYPKANIEVFRSLLCGFIDNQIKKKSHVVVNFEKIEEHSYRCTMIIYHDDVEHCRKSHKAESEVDAFTEVICSLGRLYK